MATRAPARYADPNGRNVFCNVTVWPFAIKVLTCESTVDDASRPTTTIAFAKTDPTLQKLAVNITRANSFSFILSPAIPFNAPNVRRQANAIANGFNEIL